jgi:hypothetical protein
MHTTIIGQSNRLPSLEEYLAPLLKLHDSDDLTVGNESWEELANVSNAIITKMKQARDWVYKTVLDWTTAFKAWTNKKWQVLKTDQQLDLIHKSKLSYFYYHSKDIVLFEKVLNECESLFKYSKSNGTLDEHKVATMIDRVTEPMQLLVSNLGGDKVVDYDPKTKLRLLSSQFTKLLKSFTPKDSDKGDPSSIEKIIALVNKKQSLLKSAGELLKDVGLESPVISDYSIVEMLCLAVFYYILIISFGLVVGLVISFIFGNIYGDYKSRQLEEQQRG